MPWVNITFRNTFVTYNGLPVTIVQTHIAPANGCSFHLDKHFTITGCRFFYFSNLYDFVPWEYNRFHLYYLLIYIF
ncbi:hypothetical protein D3C87_2022120 [compost metagenome]